MNRFLQRWRRLPPDDLPDQSPSDDEITYNELRQRGMSKSLIKTIEKASTLITLKETLDEIESNKYD
jgi:hypothetical protein